MPHQIEQTCEISNSTKQKIRNRKIIQLNSIQNSPSQFICNICLKTFPTNHQLTWHKRYHKAQIIPSDTKITDQQNLQTNKAKEKDVKIVQSFSCNNCDKYFDSISNFTTHKRLCHNVNTESKTTINLHSNDIVAAKKDIHTENKDFKNTNGRRLRQTYDVTYKEDNYDLEISENSDDDFEPTPANDTYKEDSDFENEEENKDWKDIIKKEDKKKSKKRKLEQKKETKKRRKEIEEENIDISKFINGLGNTEVGHLF